MAASVDTIHEYFQRFGWQSEFDETTQTWVTGFRGETSNFNVLVHLTESWLYFIISPFVNAPQSSVCEQRLHQHLLRLNHSINMAKFSVDAEGDIVLTVELPTDSLSYSDFCDGLNALSYYADGHFLDVLNVAQDPSYIPVQPPDEDWVSANQSDEFDKPN